MLKKTKNLEVMLREVDYRKYLSGYVPSKFALEFVNFIKMVNGGAEENKSAIVHYLWLDAINQHNDVLLMCMRGAGKTTVIAEYGALYVATYGTYPLIGKTQYAFYISDTIENGVKNFRNNLEYRWSNSDFLQQVVPYAHFTETEWTFRNLNNHEFSITGLGVNSNPRGKKKYGIRPTLAWVDDVLSNKTAEQSNIAEIIEDLLYKALRPAMHPDKKKIIWTGTPFNKKDPIVRGCSNPQWNSFVFPVANQFPCNRADFIGAWEDRFSYDSVKREYDILKASGNINAFNQEMMLRITSDEDRLILDNDIVLYDDRDYIIKNKENYYWYITTDFATSEKEKADYSVISVWAVDYEGNYYWVDGIIKRQTMDKNIDNLFEYIDKYNIMSVGVEISGQQKGFVSWIKREMMNRQKYFVLASDKSGSEEGLRPTTNKLTRFNTVLPMFKQKKIHLPNNFDNAILNEMVDELENVTKSGFKSLHDDFLDSVSQLPLMKCITPNSPEEKQPSVQNNSASVVSNFYFSVDSVVSEQQDTYFI